MPNPEKFREFFCRAAKVDPYPYQETLAGEVIHSRAICVPTGAGKTAAVVLAWLWRLQEDAGRTPLRLVYCLPMRTLVEQTRRNVDQWIENLGVKVGVYSLMGGEVEEGWEVFPEKPAILVGTQDMLLSRALNRGYAMSRYRWPVAFGLLNNDSLWVLDEVQLMGDGLASSIQLQAMRHIWPSFGACATWWMSATMDESWLKTVDSNKIEATDGLKVHAKDAVVGRLKDICQAKKPLEKIKALDVTHVMKVHRPGVLTVAVLNTVARARNLYQSLTAQYPESKKRKSKTGTATEARPEVILLHSRFRPMDRCGVMRRLLLADLALRGQVVKAEAQDAEWLERVRRTGLITVATQVLEAGVDISAEILISEVAPWSSLVQRFGRCNREGKQEAARAYWADVSNKEAAPYEPGQFKDSREKLSSLSDVGITFLEAMGTPTRSEFTHVIRQHDVHGLFATEPDLAKSYTDVSRYVRDMEREATVYVFWREKPSVDEPGPKSGELCPVLLYEFSKFLQAAKATGLEWNGETSAWERRGWKDVHPGMTLLLDVAQGGYTTELGWTGDADDRPATLNSTDEVPDGDDADPKSETDWGLLAKHLSEAQVKAEGIVLALGLTDSGEGRAVSMAAKWHDIGKNHERWQTAVRASMERSGTPVRSGGPWAKFPQIKGGQFRPGLRHEAASGLWAFEQWQKGEPGWAALTVYLVAAHHGKVRTVLRSRTKSANDLFGLRPGEELPALDGWLDSAWPLDFRCRAFGAYGSWDDAGVLFQVTTPSWVSMVAELLGPETGAAGGPDEIVPAHEPRNMGPFRLAYLEALVTAADARASRARSAE